MPAAVTRSWSATIVVIDQAPIRRTSAAECTTAMAQLDAARAAWNRFEREDKPAFARWRAREFGPLLSRARDVEVQIRENEMLVHEIEMEMRTGFLDPHTAYRRVMARRADPSAVVEETPPPKKRSGGPRPLSDFEKEALFQEWVQRSLGTNPDKMDDDVYLEKYEAFKSHMFRPKTDEPLHNSNRRASGAVPVEAEEEEPELPKDARVKELYRLLVRRLHPDLRADGNVAASALWHEVQEAYAAGDIAQLEILLALSGIESESLSEQTTVAQMRALLVELERALFALDDSLRQARDEDSWDFARAGAVSGLRSRVERQLQMDLRVRLSRLDVLQRTLTTWSRPPFANAAGYGESIDRRERARS